MFEKMVIGSKQQILYVGCWRVKFLKKLYP